MTADFDITDLGLTAVPEEVEPEAYVPAYSTENKPVDAGTYAATLIEGSFEDEGPVIFGSATSKKNGKSYLAARFQVAISDAIINGVNVGTRNLYGRVNAIPESLIFNEVKKGRESANQFMDLLRAAGYSGPLVTWDDYKNALLSLIEANAPLRVRVDWSAYSNPTSTDYAGTGETLRGMKNFPIGSNGKPDPHAVFLQGSAQEHSVLARNELKGFYPAAKQRQQT